MIRNEDSSTFSFYLLRDILANAALKKLDWQMAEHAFVKLQDYNGIQFLKRLRNIQSDALKRAEVCVFLGDLEAAEKIYFENDRRYNNDIGLSR